jgi:hypothetical protein
MADRKGPVLVIGGTGQQGATGRHLLERDRTARALMRDPASPAAPIRAGRPAGAAGCAPGPDATGDLAPRDRVEALNTESGQI